MDGEILLWNNLKRRGTMEGYYCGGQEETKVRSNGCVLCGAGMTLDAAWLHMAWLRVTACGCVVPVLISQYWVCSVGCVVWCS